jgi:hypothetical protein
MADSNTTIGPGSAVTDAELVKPDAQVLAQMQGNALATQAESHDTPKIPHVKLGMSYGGVGWGLANRIPAGDLCFDQKQVVAQQGQALVCIINGVRKFWKEWPAGPYDANYRPQMFWGGAEGERAAIAAGFITQWGPKGGTGPKRNCTEGAVLELFVREPKDCTNNLPFCIMLNGLRYAPAQMYVEKGLYDSCKNRLDQLQRSEAASRNVSPDRGKHNQYFVTLVVGARPRKDGKTDWFLNLNPLDVGGRPAPVDEATRADLAKLALQISAASSGPADVGDSDVPF